MTRARKVRIALSLALVAAMLFFFFRVEAEPTIENGSTLVIELDGEYVEAQETPLVARLLGDGGRPFVGLLSRFAMARRDDRLGTVVLRIGNLGLGWAQAQEVRDAIQDLRDAGRRVVAHIDVFGVGASREYFVATAADEIHLAPGAGIALVGLAAEYMYLGEVWEKIGVEIDVTRVGKYKSATESISGDHMSDAAREMANSLLDSIFGQFVAAIAAGRGLDEAVVRAAIEDGPVLPDALKKLGLIDGTRDFHELLDAQPGQKVLPEDYAKVRAATVGFEPKAQIALVYGTGNVVSGTRSKSPTGSGAFASRSTVEALLEAAKDPAIDAILFRIDSPGGSATASEEIWQGLRRARQEGGKPIVASLSDVAASGGYYVVSGADAIIAAPATLTGSIGVFVLRPVLAGVFEKIGLNVESLTRGRHADLLLGSQPLSPGARARMQSLTDDSYALFTQRVSEGRKLSADAVELAAQGRVWTGAQALEVGLIDGVGGLSAAVDQLRSRLELEPDADVALLPYPAPQTLASQIGSLLEGRMSLSALLRSGELDPLSQLVGQVASWVAELPPNTPLFVPPLVVEIR